MRQLVEEQRDPQADVEVQGLIGNVRDHRIRAVGRSLPLPRGIRRWTAACQPLRGGAQKGPAAHHADLGMRVQMECQ